MCRLRNTLMGPFSISIITLTADAGEMIFPFQFDTMPELESLRSVADIIAQYSGWPELYDEWQLARNEVPLYATTYVDDMYVCKYTL
jgi:hypothetical protein